MNFNFLFSDSHVEVISGKQEGENLLIILTVMLKTVSYCNYVVMVLIFPVMSLSLGVYAWIGINFVLGRFNHIDDGELLAVRGPSAENLIHYCSV